MAGCQGPEGGGIALKIHYTGEDVQSGTLLPRGTPPTGIDLFRLCVTADDMDKVHCENFEVQDYNASGKVRLGGLPPGENRKVSFQGWKAPGSPSEEPLATYCGGVTGIKIKNRSTTPVSMFLSKCSSFAEIKPGEMGLARAFHTATRLNNGKVFLVGGFDEVVNKAPVACTVGQCQHLTATPTTEIYDPTTGTFEQQTPTMIHARALHTATLLSDGRVLVTGGCDKAIWRVSFPNPPGPGMVLEAGESSTLGTAGSTGEILDPVGGAAPVEITLVNTAVAMHSTIGLPDNRVLLIGGVNGNNLATNKGLMIAIKSGDQPEMTELPAVMETTRAAMTLVPFGVADNHTTLVWGGNHAGLGGQDPDGFAEILAVDPSAAVSKSKPAFVTQQQAYGWPSFHSAGVLLDSGQVLISGGMVIDSTFSGVTDRPSFQKGFRLIDMTPAGEQVITPISAAMIYPRALHTLTQLPAPDAQTPGDVLLTGGAWNISSNLWNLTETAEFYSPTSQTFEQHKIDSDTVSLAVPRVGHTAVLLTDGTVLVSGGLTLNTDGTKNLDVTKSSEVYNPTARKLWPN
jgi:hypothetical protein